MICGTTAEVFALMELVGGAEEDQTPIFIVDASDPIGHAALRAWANLHRLNGGDDPSYSAAMAHADKMEAWLRKKEDE